MAGGVDDGVYTYDIPLADGGPRVPDAADLGGLEIQDNEPPPHKGAERSADMDNVQTATLAGLARMGSTCRLTIEFPLGTATIVQIASMGTLDPLTLGTAFTLNQDAGTGDLVIEWADGTLPPQNGKPRVWLTDSTGTQPYATSGNNFVEVFTFDSGAAPADLAFCVEIFG